MVNELNTLAARIKFARERSGLKPADIARHFGISRPAVAQWEKEGGTRPDSDRYHELARLLGVTTEWLLTGQDGPSEGKNIQSPPISESAASRGLANGEMFVYLGAETDSGTFTLKIPASIIERPPYLVGVRNPPPFGVRIMENSMEPRFRVGDTLEVDPSQPALPGHDVVIELDDLGERRAMVKNLVSLKNSVLVVQQHNPAKKIEIPNSKIVRLYKVVGVRYT